MDIVHSSTDSLHWLIQVLLLYIINETFQLHHSLLPQVDEEQASQKGEANALLMAWNKSHTDPCGHTNLSCHQTSSKQIKTRCRVIVPSISFVVIYAKHIESPMGGSPRVGSELIWLAIHEESERWWCMWEIPWGLLNFFSSMHRWNWKKKIVTFSTIICPWVFHWLTSPTCTFPIPVFSTQSLKYDLRCLYSSHKASFALASVAAH